MFKSLQNANNCFMKKICLMIAVLLSITLFVGCSSSSKEELIVSFSIETGEDIGQVDKLALNELESSICRFIIADYESLGEDEILAIVRGVWGKWGINYPCVKVEKKQLCLKVFIGEGNMINFSEKKVMLPILDF